VALGNFVQRLGAGTVELLALVRAVARVIDVGGVVLGVRLGVLGIPNVVLALGRVGGGVLRLQVGLLVVGDAV
jgi:hypothetical protein